MASADEMLDRARARPGELAAGELTATPLRRVAILACMDTRIELYALLGIERGDAHILRNAGGLVTDDAIRSLSASQRLLGTEEVIVVMHEGCGLLGASDEEFAAALAADGAEPGWSLGGFTDLEAALKDGLARLRDTPALIARDRIRGFVYDPADGSLRDVEA
jgi:carbonic anhydrase